MEKVACGIIAMLMTMTAIAIIGNTDKISYRPMGNKICHQGNTTP